MLLEVLPIKENDARVHSIKSGADNREKGTVPIVEPGECSSVRQVEKLVDQVYEFVDHYGRRISGGDT